MEIRKPSTRIWRSRAEKILTLIPNLGIDSDDGLSDDDNWTEEQLEEGVNTLFQEIGTQNFYTESAEPVSIVTDRHEPGPSDQPSPIISTTPNCPAPTTADQKKSTGRGRKRTAPSIQLVRKKPKIQKKSFVVKWKKARFCCNVTVPPSPFEDVPFDEDACVRSALSYFQDFFTDDCVDLIVEQTNIYSLQQTGHCLGVDRDAVKAFIGMHLLMGIIGLPAVTDYWSPRFYQKKIADVMSLKKFQQLRRFIHFANNTNQDDDPFYKIRPIAELIRKNCAKIEPEKKYSIDEMMVPYKGSKAGCRKQYMPKKPCKWGFKMYVRSGISGVVYDFLLYSGSSTFHNITFTSREESMSFSSQVVIALCKSIQDVPLSTVFCDNFFTSLELLFYLRENLGILTLGTIRANRTQVAPLTSEKIVNRKPRGWYEEFTDKKKKIALVQWLDSKPVLLASTFVSVDPVTTITRWSKAERAHVEVPCPRIIQEYNKHMGGVDLSDMLVALYKTPLRSHRWYLALFAQLLDICVSNAWLVYRRDMKKIQKEEKKTSKKTGKSNTMDHRTEDKEQNEPQKRTITEKTRKKKKQLTNPDESFSLPLKEFRADIAEQLIRYAVRTKSGGPSPFFRKKTSRGQEGDQSTHYATFTSKGKCRHCHVNQTIFFCASCNKRLCQVPKRNCFFDHHNSGKPK